jgi:hypothetical protein
LYCVILKFLKTPKSLQVHNPPFLTHLNLSHIRRNRHLSQRTLESTADLSKFPIQCLKNTLKSLVLHETEFDSDFLNNHVLKCTLIEYLDISQVPVDTRFDPETYVERPVSLNQLNSPLHRF